MIFNKNRFTIRTEHRKEEEMRCPHCGGTVPHASVIGEILLTLLRMLSNLLPYQRKEIGKIVDAVEALSNSASIAPHPNG